MAELKTVRGTKLTAGDAAVSGLLYGILAGTAMTGYLLAALGAGGESPTEVLNRFGSEGGAATPLVGLVNHTAVSAIYGLIFGLLWRPVGRVGYNWKLSLLAGLLYAGLLFALAQFVLLPAGDSPLLDVPVHFGLSHVIYGLVLGYLYRPKG